ncbi:MAG TPA: MFS transporter [Solirubrobacteraceae bacterium]|nr:MFS transporter [Solirubrobacteraceae bacterium]
MSVRPVTLPARPDRVDRRGIGILACGHACVDMAQGAVPALIPFLIHHRHYSYAAAAALLLAMTITSSLIQPVFGHYADRRSLPWLLPGGVLIAGIGIGLSGLMPSYPLTFAAVALAGVGVGAYHPEAARYANYVSGHRRASGMSLFSVGGNVGFALGPVLVTPVVLLLGLHATPWLIVPYLVVAASITASLPHLLSFRPDAPGARANRSSPSPASPRPDRWRPFSLVAGVAAFRSGAYFGLQAFIPSYFISHFGASTGQANAALTVLLVSGAVGTLVGGRLADRIGRRPILVGCMAVLPPLILLVLVSGQVFGFVLLALVGFFIIGNFSITVVLGQEFLPNRIGIAAGVTLGAAIGVGGVTSALLGLLADAAGLTTVMLVIAALPIPGLACALALPRGRARGKAVRRDTAREETARGDTVRRDTARNDQAAGGAGAVSKPKPASVS